MLTASDIVERTGMAMRQVQFWTDAGALKCLPDTDRQGRGRRRVYASEELTYAAIAAALASLRVPVGVGRRIIALLRDQFADVLALAAQMDGVCVIYTPDGEMRLLDPGGAVSGIVLNLSLILRRPTFSLSRH